MLNGGTNCSFTKFGSSICNDSYIIPFIKVNFDGCICNEGCCEDCCHKRPNVREVEVTGAVAAESKYETIIDVEITRQASGIKDYYYVTDEYDNSLSTPLYIDKTYKIAILPPENPGDTEEINLYGSYKG